jgi:hypothetical protein
MNKIIYKQKNKILLALLVLGGAVRASSYRSCVSGLYSLANYALGRRPATTSEAFTSVVPSNIGHNPGSSNGPSLPGSSGDTTIAQSTQVETGTTLTVINPLNGTRLLRSTKLHYSEVIAKIREQLGQGLRVILTQNGQVIPSNTTDKLEGEIGYVRGGSIISVIPSCYDELCSKLQGFIHEDFLKLHRPRPGHYFSFSEDQFHHINITRVVDRFIWPEEFDEDRRHLINTDALQSDVIETLKVLCDNIDNNSQTITTLRRYLAETPTRLQFEFVCPSPNIILIGIKTPPEYMFYSLAYLDKDGNFVIRSYATDLPEWI